MNPNSRRTRKQEIIRALCVCIFISLPAAAQSPDNVVPVSAEANHRIRFDNGTVRMYEVELPKGKSTAFHEHTLDNFAVQLVATTRAIELKGGQRVDASVQAGQTGFSSTAKGPYSHRVEATGDVPYRVIAMEIFSANKIDKDAVRVKRSPPFTVAVQENPRGQAYRLILKPGETSGPFERPANTAIFAIRGGRTSELIDGKAPRLWDSETGNFRWTDEPLRLSIRNEGVTAIEFVEIEVF